MTRNIRLLSHILCCCLVSAEKQLVDLVKLIDCPKAPSYGLRIEANATASSLWQWLEMTVLCNKQMRDGRRTTTYLRPELYPWLLLVSTWMEDSYPT